MPVAGVFGGVGITAQQVGDHAFETPFGNRGGRLDIWKAGAALGPINAVKQQITGRGTEVFNRGCGVKLEPVGLRGIFERFGVMLDIVDIPAVDGIIETQDNSRQ